MWFFVYIQLLDELPMVVASFCSLYCALEFENRKPRKFTFFAILFCCALQCILYVVFKMYLIFLIGFALVMALQISIILRKVSKDYKLKKSKSCWLMVAVAVLLILANLFWNIENIFCAYVQNLRFHAMWHLTGGYGIYLFDLLLIFLRGQSLKKQPELNFSKDVGLHFVKWTEV